MLKQNNSPYSRNKFSVLFLLFFLVPLIYSNTFQSSWHFDDKPNIVSNPRVHIRELTCKSIFNALYANPSNDSQLSRPFAYLTFALNWYFNKDDVTGYHLVNIAIHIITAFFLYLSIINLFKTPNLRDKYKPGSEHFIAFLAAAMWAANPIQTQAVTYIVQRMALLAALFYVLGIYFYVRSRISKIARNRVLFLLGCVLSFILALGSKENAAMFPLALVLVEIVFFQDHSLQKTRRLLLGIVLASGVLVILIGILFFMKGDPLFFLKGYSYRPFSFTERLMTEPRIVIYYLSQIFYPTPLRLSIQHDVIISTGLLKPWTTLPAILAVFLLVGTGLFLVKKRPLIAFAILFFFLNHVIESTIIPLELMYEHRNYLPSLFLFLPVSVGIKRLIDYYREKKILIYFIIISFVTLILITFGIGTYTRNMAWATEKSLWEDAIKKAPQSTRPYYRLAVPYSDMGQLDKSIALLRKGFLSKQQKPVQAKLLFYNNMGNIYRKKHEYEIAIKYLQEALNIEPNNRIARENIILVLIESKKWDLALKHLDILIKKRYFNYFHPYLKGYVLLRKHRIDEAISYFRYAMRLSPYNRDVLINTGIAFSLLDMHQRGLFFLKRANRLYPNDALILLCLAEISLKKVKDVAAGGYLETLLSVFGGKKVQEFIEGQSKGSFAVPISYELLIPVIADKVDKRAREFIRMSSKIENSK